MDVKTHTADSWSRRPAFDDTTTRAPTAVEALYEFGIGEREGGGTRPQLPNWVCTRNTTPRCVSLFQASCSSMIFPLTRGKRIGACT